MSVIGPPPSELLALVGALGLASAWMPRRAWERNLLLALGAAFLVMAAWGYISSPFRAG